MLQQSILDIKQLNKLQFLLEKNNLLLNGTIYKKKYVSTLSSKSNFVLSPIRSNII